MHMLTSLAIVLCVAAAAAAASAAAPVLPYTAPLGYKVVDASGLTPLKTHNASTLYVRALSRGVFL